jgi:hypothetical protein
VLLSNTEVMQLHATSDHYDFDFHAFSLSGFDVTVNKQENGSTYPSIDWVGAIFSGSQKIWQPKLCECTRCVICRILPSSRLMKAMSGVLESPRQALSIGSTCSFIGRLFLDHLG